MTAGAVRKKYPIFGVYAYKIFASALITTRNQQRKEFEAQCPQTGHGDKNREMKAFLNYDNKDEDDDTYDLSKMLLKDHDDFSYNTKDDMYGLGGKSVTFSGVDSFVGKKVVVHFPF